jgi:hypothetical protein
MSTDTPGSSSPTPTGGSGGGFLTVVIAAAVIVVAVVLVLSINSNTLETTNPAPKDTGPVTTVKPADPAATKPPAPATPDKPAVDASGDPIPPHPLQASVGFTEADKLGDLAPLALELPNPAFAGTPKNIPAGAKMLKPTGKARPPFLAPKGSTNIAMGKPITSSDKFPIIGDLSLVTDGDKEPLDGRWVELAPGKQWVQIDLGAPADIFAIVIWHHHMEARVYKDVVVQVSDDPAFAKDVKTLFNNDADNSSGLGAGKDYEYFENYEGFLIPVHGNVKARYVRCYSKGSTTDDQNHYTEVEVWGKGGAPVPAPEKK